MSAMTLTLDPSARPVGLIPIESAVSRLAQTMADIRLGRKTEPRAIALAQDETRLFRSAGNPWEEPIEIPAPHIILCPDIPSKVAYKQLTQQEMSRVTRRVLFARDKFACQYCEFEANPKNCFKVLTVDHVKPAHLFPNREASTRWDNCVAACISCNRRKGGKLPYEAHMYPRVTPKTPHFVQLRFAGRLNQPQRDYVAEYFRINPEEIMF